MQNNSHSGAKLAVILDNGHLGSQLNMRVWISESSDHQENPGKIVSSQVQIAVESIKLVQYCKAFNSK